jgi:hypothetical protein
MDYNYTSSAEDKLRVVRLTSDNSTKGDAGIAQLVEHNLAKVGVAGSNPVSRSINAVRSEK